MPNGAMSFLQRERMAGTYSNLNFHIIFSTKDRENKITSKLEEELHRYISGIAQGENAILLKIGGTENHVHLVIKLKPRHSIPDILKRIKANSSKWINDHQKIDNRFAWQVGYGIFSVSESQLPHVLEYVANQKKRHHHKTFQEEFIQLLEKHGIEYELEYLWE